MELTNQEIDIAVARKLGWVRCNDEDEGEIRWHTDTPLEPGKHGGQCRSELPAYSTSIEAAWEIVEFVPHDIYEKWFRLTRIADGYLAGWYRVMGAYQESDSPIAEEQADTAPLAICKAFLKLDEEDPR